MTIDDLARLMANGFAELKEELRSEFIPRFETLERKVDAILLEMSEMRFDSGKMKKRVENLEVTNYGSIQAA